LLIFTKETSTVFSLLIVSEMSLVLIYVVVYSWWLETWRW